MVEVKTEDYYEVLQISPNADPETIHRVYRLLAQRFHPDNQETGSAEGFRVIHEAYSILSDPARRAQYDIAHHQRRHDRWRLVSTGAKAEDNFELEQITRLTLLEILYTRRRTEPGDPGMGILELEQMLGRPREHLEFTVWYVVQKNFARRADDSRLTITAEGVEYYEQHYRTNLQRRRLQTANEPH